MAQEKSQEMIQKLEQTKRNLDEVEKFISELSDKNLEKFTEFGEGFMAGFVAGNKLAKEGAA